MKGLIVFSNNMEDGEALTTRALLVRAGFEMTSITFQNSLSITTAFGLNILANLFATDVTIEDYDFIVIPGGKYVAQIVDADHNIKKLATLFHQKQKLVAAICAGPRFLGQAGILDGVNYTCFTGSEKDMPKGIYHPELKAIRDQNIITARGAGGVYEFVYEIVKYYYGEEKAESLSKSILY
jgi:4-methyl-5(b-hydroxyethyl)-thiazole monophosphate biosynthesis